jgi:hypothetical protein
MAFHARSPMYAQKRAHMRAIFLRSVKVSQFTSFLWCATLTPLFCTRSRAFICSPYKQTKQNKLVSLVRKRTIPTERPPLVSEIYLSSRGWVDPVRDPFNLSPILWIVFVRSTSNVVLRPFPDFPNNHFPYKTFRAFLYDSNVPSPDLTIEHYVTGNYRNSPVCNDVKCLLHSLCTDTFH